MFPVLSLILLGATAAHAARFTAQNSVRQEPDLEDDLIRGIPGYEGYNEFDHYSGYIDVGENQTKHLFYYLAKAQEDSETAPLIMWLNGGPGCSSFGGFAYEVGPFKFNLRKRENAKNGLDVYLTDNPYAWDKVANVLFLDSPAGVGLSYSDNPHEDYFTGDKKTAADAYEFLCKFFDKHPELASNDFYLAGESYAGVYVPNLARLIVENNKDARPSHALMNLQGYLLGNPTCSEEIDGNSLPRFALGMSMISPKMFNELEKACEGGHYWNRTKGSKACQTAFDDLCKLIDGVFYYNILSPCYTGPDDDLSVGKAPMSKAEEMLGGRMWPMPGTFPRAGEQVRNWAHLGFTPKCTAVDSRHVEAWLNDPMVRKRLHAASEDKIGRFQPCTDAVNYTREHDGDMMPVHHFLLDHNAHGLRALIYSGDHDSCIPHTGTETWTSKMGYKIASPWQPWFYADKMGAEQVAGFTVEYEHLTYATIKGGGHMVPQTNPVQAYQMMKRYLKNEPLYPPIKEEL